MSTIQSPAPETPTSDRLPAFLLQLRSIPLAAIRKEYDEAMREALRSHGDDELTTDAVIEEALSSVREFLIGTAHVLP